MNSKVAKMLRKTGHSNRSMKRYWNGLNESQRQALRKGYNETMAEQRALTKS